jgi:hypothetical protein
VSNIIIQLRTASFAEKNGAAGLKLLKEVIQRRRTFKAEGLTGTTATKFYARFTPSCLRRVTAT